MSKKLPVRSLGLLARIADALMVPVMYLLSGTTEKPQQTHRWNNTKLTSADVKHLEPNGMVHCEGVPNTGPRFRWSIPAFHTPIFGGWKDYVVLEPSELGHRWHVGWIADDVVGISRIELPGPVRVLLGPGDTSFFGVTTEGIQVSINPIGTGHIGEHGSHGQVPLL